MREFDWPAKSLIAKWESADGHYVSVSVLIACLEVQTGRVLPYNPMSTTEKESLLSGKQSGSTYTDLADSSTLSQFRKNSVAEAGGQYMTLFNEWLEKATNPWVWFVKTTHARQCLAEFFGTFLLVVSLLLSILFIYYYNTTIDDEFVLTYHKR